MLKITFENIIKIATFVAPDGIIYCSPIMHDEVKEYNYVADGNGETWPLDEVNVLRVDEYTQTETAKLDCLTESTFLELTSPRRRKSSKSKS